MQVFHVEFQQNLFEHVMEHALCKLGFIMNQRDWKLQLPQNIQHNSPMSNFTEICWMIYAIIWVVALQKLDSIVYESACLKAENAK